jgi:hypothetical protein
MAPPADKPSDGRALDSKSLAVWTDAELEAELSRRRTRRLAGKLATEGAPPPAGGRVERALSSIEREREVAQAYANLELAKGATLDDVEKKYRQLAEKYAPEKQGSDPGRIEVARQLGDMLRGAYQRLVQHLTPRT